MPPESSTAGLRRVAPGDRLVVRQPPIDDATYLARYRVECWLAAQAAMSDAEQPEALGGRSQRVTPEMLDDQPPQAFYDTWRWRCYRELLRELTGSDMLYRAHPETSNDSTARERLTPPGVCWGTALDASSDALVGDVV